MKHAVATLSLAVLTLTAQAQTKEAALADAIAKKQKDAVASLIERGADVNALHEGATPLYRATLAADVEIVELLLSRGADVNAPSSDRDLPLRTANRFANAQGAFEVVERLMAASAGRNARTAEKLAPLHAANAMQAQINTVQIVRTLLARGARVDARDSAGNTPLFWAGLGYNQSGAELLLQRGADVNARNNGGFTALDAASAMGHSMLRTWLLARGAFGSMRSLPTDLNLHDRLDRARSPLTAYVLGQRNDDAALRSILNWRDAQLLEAYLREPFGVSKFRMDRGKFELLHPALKRQWLSERARDSVVRQISRSGLPGIEQPLLETLPFASERARRDIEERLAERRFEPVLPYIAEHAVDGNYVTCQNLARIGSTAATRVMTRCLAKVTELERRGHNEVLNTLSKHGVIPEVDFVALRKALPAVMDEPTTARYFELVGQHQSASEVPVLIAAMRDNPPASSLGRAARGALSRFESEKVQRQVVEELHRLRAAGRIDEPAYRFVTFSYAELTRLSEFYHSGSVERDRTAHLYERDKEEVGRYRLSAEQSREARPEQFARDYDDYLKRVALLAGKYRDSVYADGLRSEVASGYLMLANFARFTLKRPSEAAEYQSKSKQALPASPGSDYMSDLSAADLLQYDFADRGKALEAYRRAADKLRAAKVDRSEWLARAVTHEIEYLEHGKVFSGSLTTEDLQQFFGVVFLAAAGAFGDPDLGLAPSQRESMSGAQRRAVEVRLGQLAPSHFNLVKAVPFLSVLSSEQSVLRFMRKHDPGGYWSASLALLVLHPDSVGERGTALLFPGVKNDIVQGTALAAAARTLAKENGVSLQAPDGRRATPEGTWQLLLQSLRAGDAATTLACFTPAMRAKIEPLFSKMTPTAMRAMADSFKAFTLEQGDGDMREAVLAREAGDKRIVGFAYFIRYAGEWKIDEM